MAIDGDHQPGHRGNILIFIDQRIQSKRLLQRMQVGRAFDQPAIAVNDDLRRLIGIREFTGDGFQDVQRRHQPLYHAKLVGHDDKAAARAAQNAEQIDRVQRFRDDNRRGGRGQRRNVFSRLKGHQQLFRPHDTDDFIQLSAADREQTVRR